MSVIRFRGSEGGWERVGFLWILHPRGHLMTLTPRWMNSCLLTAITRVGLARYFKEAKAYLHWYLETLENITGQAAKITTTQIRTTLDFRAVRISHATNLKNNEINENMHELSKQGVQENSYMKRMTYQSTRDTRFMTIISLTTAIFLPATLVAVSIGKIYFKDLSLPLQTNILNSSGRPFSGRISLDLKVKVEPPNCGSPLIFGYILLPLYCC